MVAALAGCGNSDPAPPAEVTINGRTWRVELATTPDARFQGLSNRKAIDPNAGMLFMYPAPQMMEFCMRQCLVPLDIAFISSDRRVVKTYTMPIEPYGLEEKSYASEMPAQYALEVAAGQLAAAGVAVGDTVEFSRGVPPAAKAAPGP